MPAEDSHPIQRSQPKSLEQFLSIGCCSSTFGEAVSGLTGFPREEVLPQPIADGADGREMDAGEVGEGSEPMTIDRVDVGQEGKILKRKKGTCG